MTPIKSVTPSLSSVCIETLKEGGSLAGKTVLYLAGSAALLSVLALLSVTGLWAPWWGLKKMGMPEGSHYGQLPATLWVHVVDEKMCSEANDHIRRIKEQWAALPKSSIT